MCVEKLFAPMDFANSTNLNFENQKEPTCAYGVIISTLT